MNHVGWRIHSPDLHVLIRVRTKLLLCRMQFLLKSFVILLFKTVDRLLLKGLTIFVLLQFMLQELLVSICVDFDAFIIIIEPLQSQFGKSTLLSLNLIRLNGLTSQLSLDLFL